MDLEKKINESESDIVTFEKQEFESFANYVYNNVGYIGSTYDSIARRRKISKKQLRTALANPTNTASIEILQDAAEIFKYTNGMVRQFTDYKSKILTYDHFLIPRDISKYKTKEDIWEARYKAATELEKYNLKYNSKWITEKILDCGEIFLFIIKDRYSVIYQQIPNKLCKICSKTGNMVSRYKINLAAISPTELVYFPQEIMELYIKYTNGQLIDDENFDNGWYDLSNYNKAVAFSLEVWGTKGVPYFASLFDNLMSLEDLEDLRNNNAVLENFILIYQKAETDEKGRMKLDKKTLQKFHEALKKVLNNTGCGAITTPMPLEKITLGDSQTKTLEYVNKVKETIYDAAGINNDIFNGNSTNTEAVSYGETVDVLLPLFIQKSIENWINDELRTSSKTRNWMVEFVKTTEHNWRQLAKDEKDGLTIYGSKWKYFATMGFTPLRAMNTLKIEELEKVAEDMKPLESAYQTSGTDSNQDSSDKTPSSAKVDEGGRPSKSDIGESNSEKNGK